MVNLLNLYSEISELGLTTPTCLLFHVFTFSRDEEELGSLSLDDSEGGEEEEGHGGRGGHRDETLDMDEDDAKQLYAGTLDAPETSPRWKQARVLFRRDDLSAHPNDDEDRDYLQTFYGYSSTLKEVHDHLQNMMQDRLSAGFSSDKHIQNIRSLAKHLPHLLVDRGCEVLALVGYRAGALEAPEAVSVFVEKQLKDLLPVSTGVENRSDVFSALSVLLVGDASLTQTLVVHTSCHILQHLKWYSSFAARNWSDDHRAEPLHTLRDAIDPSHMKFLSPITVQALADVLGCNISVYAGAPTVAQTDPYCRALTHNYNTHQTLTSDEEDVRPTELALLAFYDHTTRPAPNTYPDGQHRIVPLPFKCYGLVPTALMDEVNENLLRSKPFTSHKRAGFPKKLLGKQLEDYERVLDTMAAGRDDQPNLPGHGEVTFDEDSSSDSHELPVGPEEEMEVVSSSTAALGSKERDESSGTEIGLGRRQESGASQEEQAMSEQDGSDTSAEPFDEPHFFDASWSKAFFLDHITMRDLFRTFMADENARPLEEKPMNPKPGAVYFCKRTKSMCGVDELPENLGAMTSATGKRVRGNRTRLLQFVDRTDENLVYWRTKGPSCLPVPTNKHTRLGSESTFTEDEAKARFYKVIKYTASHTTRSGEALRVGAYV